MVVRGWVGRSAFFLTVFDGIVYINTILPYDLSILIFLWAHAAACTTSPPLPPKLLLQLTRPAPHSRIYSTRRGAANTSANSTPTPNASASSSRHSPKGSDPFPDLNILLSLYTALNCQFLLTCIFRSHYYPIMIYPEADQHIKIEETEVNFPFNLTHLKARSPTLPLHFDRRYLPRDLCEKQLLSVTECLLLYNINQEEVPEMCKLQSSKFESCRRRRDLRILSGIYKWQTQHWLNLDQQNKGMYLMGLNRKLSRLEDDFRRQPSTISGLNRSQLIEQEIKELRWRLQYLNKAKTTLSN